MTLSEQGEAVPSEERSESFDSNVFLRSVNEVAFAARTYKDYPALAGVLLHFREEGLELTASDGNRLGKTKIVTEINPSNYALKVVTPASYLSKACNLLFDKSRFDKATVRIVGPDIILESDHENASVKFALMDDQYPPVDGLIPAKTEGVTFERESFLSLIQPHEDKSAVIISPFEKNIMQIKQVIYEHPEEVEVLVNSNLEVEGNINFPIVLDSRYLVDLFTNVESTNKLSLESFAQFSQVLFRNPRDDNFLHMIMPINWPKRLL